MDYTTEQVDFLQFGASGFLGRTLYIQAIDFSRVEDNILRGQNGVVRHITEAAVKDFIRLGGYGANKEIAYTPLHSLENPANIAYINSFFSGVSHKMMMYWWHKTLGEDQIADSFIDSPFFTELSFSEGKTLQWWVKYGFRQNPGTPYQIFGLDYGFYPSQTQDTTIFDRLIELTRSNAFPPVRQYL